MKNVLKPLAERVLIPLGSTASASATDAAIQKGMTTLIISNEEMDDITKIVKSLKDSGLLIKGVIETIKNEARKQRSGFLDKLLDTLGASFLGIRKSINRYRGNESR